MSQDRIKIDAEMEAALLQADKDIDSLGPALDAYDKIGGDTSAFRGILLDARNRIQLVRKYFGNSPGAGYGNG